MSSKGIQIPATKSMGFSASSSSSRPPANRSDESKDPDIDQYENENENPDDITVKLYPSNRSVTINPKDKIELLRNKAGREFVHHPLTDKPMDKDQTVSYYNIKDGDEIRPMGRLYKPSTWDIIVENKLSGEQFPLTVRERDRIGGIRKRIKDAKNIQANVKLFFKDRELPDDELVGIIPVDGVLQMHKTIN